jgi:hypothetical protein
MISIPVSAGELLDKISILRIKRRELTDSIKRKNVETELRLLEQIASSEFAGKSDYSDLMNALGEVNAKLWHIEEAKRDCERKQIFDDSFVRLARSVYIENDRRAAIKRDLNIILGSEIVEEKSYQPYMKRRSS